MASGPAGRVMGAGKLPDWIDISLPPALAALLALVGRDRRERKDVAGARAPSKPGVLGARTLSSHGSAEELGIPLEIAAQAQHRLRVELIDPRLRDAQDFTDLFEGHPFVIVERHDQALALRQPVNGRSEHPAPLV